MCIMCVPGTQEHKFPWSREASFGPPVARVTGDCVPPVWVMDTELSPPQDQVLLTTKPSFQTQNFELTFSLLIF